MPTGGAESLDETQARQRLVRDMRGRAKRSWGARRVRALLTVSSPVRAGYIRG
jgi:hypothetical protein